ncbi:MAG TPA: helix-turn-helix domain-containing protein [Anaerolineaceae bacterium]
MADEWLEVYEAARLLGVHQSTLRRWADAGKISHMRTLSGRRRFSRASIEEARKEMVSTVPLPPAPDPLGSLALDRARERSHKLDQFKASWIHQLNEEQRLLFRYSGQRLVSLMEQYVHRAGPAHPDLDEGQHVAADYGRVCCHAGLTIAQTAEAFLYFRRSVLESVLDASAEASNPDCGRTILKAVEFFDFLLVAMMESHAQASQ